MEVGGGESNNKAGSKDGNAIIFRKLLPALPKNSPFDRVAASPSGARDAACCEFQLATSILACNINLMFAYNH